MAADADELGRSLARYAECFHAAVGYDHHVASPLGAWLLLALTGPAASGHAAAQLAEVLGLDVDAAATRAAGLLDAPHPLVAASVAVWYRRWVATAQLEGWLAALPDSVEQGDLPTQAAADAWARQRTDGLLDRFLITVTDDTLLVLASALATGVTWSVPFEVVAASRLGPVSPWRGQLARVLLSRPGHHDCYIAATDRAGDVAVLTAEAQGGLLVTSVIASPETPPGDVLSVAHDLAVAAVTRPTVTRRSLFEMPLGDGVAWTLTERTVRTMQPSGREELLTAIIPAWSARDNHDLISDKRLGFQLVARILEPLLPPDPRGHVCQAKQSLVARYSRTGFEAAAGTAFEMAVGAMPTMRQGVAREAEVRFGHPYAVVAVVGDETNKIRGPWFGLPVFSAWIADPDEAEVAVGEFELAAHPPLEDVARGMAPARWAGDPTGRHQLRYWDGRNWTRYVSDRGS
jgi:hypothetical protein